MQQYVNGINNLQSNELFRLIKARLDNLQHFNKRLLQIEVTWAVFVPSEWDGE
jgi:hypothetical protein